MTGTVIGVLAMALGLSGPRSGAAARCRCRPRPSSTAGWPLGLLLVAVIFGLADETGRGALFAAAGAGALVVTTITRYSARPAN